MHTRQPNLRGFTLMELIVATTIALAMMTFVAILFSTSQRAVHMSIGVGESNLSSETTANQLSRDAELMADPTGGILVIVQKRYGPQSVTGTLGDTGTVMPDTGFNNYIELPGQTTRSDQLVFIAVGGGASIPFHSVTPRDHDSMFNQLRAQRARLWYGHVRTTTSDGLDGPRYYPSNDTPAHRWVLGRQALLLGPLPYHATNEPNGYTGNDTHAQAASTTSKFAANSVVDYQPPPPPVIQPFGANPPLYRGITDVMELGTPGYDPVSMFGNLATFPDDYLNATYAFNDGTDDGRLRCNVNPAGSGNYGYWGWQMAQSHSYLATNVSDFIVEFAADIEDDTSIPNNAAGMDGEPDRYPTGHPLAGKIIWYSAWDLPDFGNMISDGISRAVPGDGGDFWKSSVGEPYDVYYGKDATSNPIPTANDFQNADNVFVFQYGDINPEGCKWPYLIRIRYRVHDDAGRIRSGTDRSQMQAGRWFEHIIKVNRP